MSPAPKGNKYGAKPEAERRTHRASTWLTREEKARLVREAGGARRISGHIRRALGLD